ncbi:MAG: hypothetical protein NT080_09100 [Spirochaetes bacterium]|nr:hypothetical protein [Spirochaetota bacterium]
MFLEADAGEFAHDWEYEGIIEAAKLGNVGILELFFAPGCGDVEPFLDAALLVSAGAGQTNAIDEMNGAVEHLLAKGADPDKVAGSEAAPPISFAILNADYRPWMETAAAQVRVLIRYGANVDAKGGEGRFPMEMARKLRYDAGREIVGILKVAGAEIPFTEDSFRHLLYENDEKNLRSFLERGVDPDLADFNYYEKTAQRSSKRRALGTQASSAPSWNTAPIRTSARATIRLRPCSSPQETRAWNWRGSFSSTEPRSRRT